MPILDLRRANRIMPSTVSTAVLKSRTRRVTCLQFMFIRMSFWTWYLCCDPFGRRIVGFDKGQIDSYDREFGRKQHALLVLI